MQLNHVKMVVHVNVLIVMLDISAYAHQGILVVDVKFEMHAHQILARTVEIANQRMEIRDINVYVHLVIVDNDVK